MEKTYPIKSIRQLTTQQKKSYKTRTGALAVTLLICMSLIASAALLQYYAKITMTVDIAGALMADGKDPPAELTDVIPDDVSPAGQTFCFHHWLRSNTPVPLGLQLNTTFNPPGNNITVNIYDMKNSLTRIYQGLNGSAGSNFMNFTQHHGGAYFGWNPLLIQVTHKNATANKTGFTLRMPRLLANTEYDYFEWWFNDDNATKRIMVRFEGDKNASAPLGQHWRYAALETGYSWAPIPSWMSVTGTLVSENFTVLIPNDRLGNKNGTDDDLGLAYTYKLTVSLYDQGYPPDLPMDDVILIQYPDPDVIQYETGYLGILTNHIDMTANEQEHLFYICYGFDVSIPPGHYVAQTTIKAV